MKEIRYAIKNNKNEVVGWANTEAEAHVEKAAKEVGNVPSTR